MLSVFSGHKAEFLLVGAYAVAVHGYPRATGDMDLYVRPTPENAHRVFAALQEFGAPLEAVSESDFATPGVIYQIGRAPNRIDLITSIAGVTWNDAWEGRYIQSVDGLSIPVIGRDALCRNKRAAGRPKDLADVAWFDAQASQLPES